MTNYFPDPKEEKNKIILEALDTHKQMVQALGVKDVYVEAADVRNIKNVLSDENGTVNLNQMHEALMDIENRYRKLDGKDELKPTQWTPAPEDIDLNKLIPDDAPVSDLINTAHIDEIELKDTPSNAEDIYLRKSKNYDPVHHPHYYDTPGGRETKEIIRDLLGPEGYKAWCIGTSVKYLSRYDRKENAIQDLRKSIEYIQMVITEIADN